MIFFNWFNNFLWIIVVIFISLLSIYFLFKLRGIQFKVIKMINYLLKSNKKGISSLKTLMLTLAGKIGVGSISGIALAIYLAGPGTVFWIWTISFLAISIVYTETYLGIKYREKYNNMYNGGPAYYIKNGLNNYKLGHIYSIAIFICYIIGFVSIQANTITKSVASFSNMSSFNIGIILCIILSLIIFNGIEKIINITSKIVPIMVFLYFILGLYVIFNNLSVIGSIFKVIIDSAFNYKSFGVGFIIVLIKGIQSGIFSNEAGIGTGSIAAAVSEENNIVASSYIQMLSVYITSFLICTITSIIIITSNYGVLNINDPNGIEIALYSFNYHFGNLGNVLLIILIILFAFSTILSAYYYGEVSLNYFKFKNVFFIRFILLIVVIIGSVFNSSYIWLFIDIFMALLALINMYAIYKLRNKVDI